MCNVLAFLELWLCRLSFEFALISSLFHCFRDADWNQAFNFSSNLDFLASCVKKTRGTSIYISAVIEKSVLSCFMEQINAGNIINSKFRICSTTVIFLTMLPSACNGLSGLLSSMRLHCDPERFMLATSHLFR